MTALNKIPMGIQGVLYVGTAGTTPTVLLNDDQKFEISYKNGVAKWATRGKFRKSSGFTDQEVTASFTVVKNNMNPAFIQVQAGAQQQMPIAIKSLDGTAGYGVDADWLIESFKEGQPIDGNDTVDIELASYETLRTMTITNGPGS